MVWFLNKKIRIDSRESLENAALTLGFLPFFPNKVKGLSVEEMCSPGLLFGGNYDEGCWEWKGPVIRRGTTAYGKFFNRKAGFVSLELLPHFLNYRRAIYPVKDASTEEMLLEIIKENDSLTSTELKRLIFADYERTQWDDLPVSSSQLMKESKKEKTRKSLEGPLQRLQMGGWIVISDFEYKTTKRGERYGWGVARYSTPENIFGEKISLDSEVSPQKSKDILLQEIHKRWKSGRLKDYESLLK